MQEAIDQVAAFLTSVTFEAYLEDAKTRSAVERQLLIIAEAATRLGGDAERLCPGLNWRGIRGMGNVLRHEYHRIDDRVVWDTAKVELPPLRAAIVRALA